MKALVAFLAGVLFSVGLVVSGMTQPGKVIGFLDFFGDWDPSLAFVMGGAVAVNALLYRFTMRRERPVLDVDFHVPNRTDIEPRLVAGGVLFGVGWGLMGYCPGPALASAPSGALSALYFVAAMIAGILLHEALLGQKRSPADADDERVDFDDDFELASGE